jgi:hypothetical protein
MEVKATNIMELHEGAGGGGTPFLISLMPIILPSAFTVPLY